MAGRGGGKGDLRSRGGDGKQDQVYYEADRENAFLTGELL